MDLTYLQGVLIAEENQYHMYQKSKQLWEPQLKRVFEPLFDYMKGAYTQIDSENDEKTGDT